MPTKSADAPGAIREALNLEAVALPPVLPGAWSATALLTPYGQYEPAMKTYSQLVVAKIQYASGNGQRVMSVGMYLPEDGVYVEWLFSTVGDPTKWIWMKAPPGGPAQGAYGPFATTLVVPEPDFLVTAGAGYTGRWPLFCQKAAHFLALTSETRGQKYGSWYGFNTDTGNLMRVINIPADYAMRLPILGAYFMANIVDFQPLTDAGDLLARAKALLDPAAGAAEIEPADYVNPLLTQDDIGNAIANPLWTAPCSLAQIRELIPGYTPLPDWPLPDWPLPEWSETVKITGYTLGMNAIPFYTEVYYSDPMQRPRSEFVGWGPTPAKESYDYRQDTVLYADYFNDVQYQFKDLRWQKLTCQRVPGIG